MKKLALGLILTAMLSACGQENKPADTQTKPTVKIGAILPLTGNTAVLGNAAKAGLQKALAEKSQQDLHYNYELILENNMGTTAATATAANKLIFQDNVDAVVTFTRGMGHIVAPIADQQNKLNFCVTFEEKSAPAMGKNSFVQGVATEDLHDKLVNILQNQHINNLAIIAANVSNSAQMADMLKQKAENSGIKAVTNIFNPGERNFQMLIEGLKKDGFDTYYISAFPPETDIIIKQLHEAGISNQSIYGQGIDSSRNFAQFEGISCFTLNLGSSHFIDAVTQEYNISNVFGTAANYDIFNLIVNCYEKLYTSNGKPTTAEIVNYITNLGHYNCEAGGCTVLPNHFIINPPARRTYQNGKAVILD